MHLGIHIPILRAVAGNLRYRERRLLSCFMTNEMRSHIDQKNSVNYRQPRRFGAKEKQERTRARINAEQKRKRDAKNRIPVLEIPHIMKISDIVQTTGRTPGCMELCRLPLSVGRDRSLQSFNQKIVYELSEQIFQAKSSCEQVKHVECQSYPMSMALSHPLLSCVIKRLGFRVEYLNSDSSTMSQDKDIYAKPVTADSSILELRPPVVAVMGHVDHGKTTVLDTLRNSSVAGSEAGGITQSIGAFSVPLPSNYTVTFLDTPGHSVFTSMRERGAQVADIVLLIVAADDGVMEQTIESIAMIKMAETPVVVAINKCDKADAAPDLIIEDLHNHGIKCEGFGGDVPAVKISALLNTGLDDLVRTIVATAELNSIKCDPTMQVQGFVLESQAQKGRGNVLVAGNSLAKVKSILDTNGRKVKCLNPGEAGSVMGWKTLPSAGQLVLQAENEACAKDALRYRAKELQILTSEEVWEEVYKRREIEKREYEKIREEHTSKKHRYAASYRVALEKNKHCDSVPVLNIIIKADVDGSMEAIMKIVNSYDCEEECMLNLVSYGIGPLKVSEYEIAKELKATVFLFNTDIATEIPSACMDEISIVKHDVIYHFVKSLKGKLSEKLPSIEKKITKGEASVLEVFKKRRLMVAGCKVFSGVMDAKDIFTLERDNVLLHKGNISSMRQHATTLSKVTSGNECGIVFQDDMEYEIEEGDILRCVTVVKEEQETSWQPHGF